MSEPVLSKNPSRTPFRRRILLLALLLTLSGGIVCLVLGVGRRSAVLEPPIIDCANTDPGVERAIALAREQVRSSPRSAKAWGHMAMVLMAHNFWPESGICLRQAEQLDGVDPRWPYFQALGMRRTDPETAIVHLRRAVELCGDEPDAPRLLLGELLLQSGRLDEAERNFQCVIRRDPANGRAHLGLGRLAYERDALSSCVPHFRQAAADTRTRKMSQIQLAAAYQRLGDSDAAAVAQNQANELPDDPGWPDPLAQQYTVLSTGEHSALNEAFVLLAADRVSEALDLMLRTLRAYPDSAQGWLLMGRGMIRNGEVPAAELALRRSIHLKQDAPEAQFYLGVALFLQKRPREALPCFRKATELQPDYPFAHYNVGECLRQLGDVPGAIEALHTALRCQPAFADAHLTLAELLSQQGQTAEAGHHLRETLRLRPEDTRARQSLERLHGTEDVPAPAKPSSPKKEP